MMTLLAAVVVQRRQIDGQTDTLDWLGVQLAPNA